MEKNLLQKELMTTELSHQLAEVIEDSALLDNESLWWVFVSSRWALAGSSS